MAMIQKSLAVAAVTLAAWAGATCVVTNVSVLQAAPQPSVVPQTWELFFTAQPVERMIVDGKTYFYIRYKVVNNTGKDILFTPDFQLMTDTGQLLQSETQADNVYKKVKALYKAEFMLSPIDIFGKLRQGEDNAKEGVAIFTGVDADARNFKIFVSGTTGDTAEVKNPLTGKTEILHKTLVLEYDIPGQAIGIDIQPQPKMPYWVMR